MAFTLNHSGVEELFHDPDGPIAEIMEGKAYDVENAAKELLMLPGAGRVYEAGVLTFRRNGKIYSNFSTGGRAAAHQASAPGQPPSSDTGHLLNSVGHTMVDTDTGIGADIGSDLDYANWLEFGTRYMAPRPWLRPALDIGLGSENPVHGPAF